MSNAGVFLVRDLGVAGVLQHVEECAGTGRLDRRVIGALVELGRDIDHLVGLGLGTTAADRDCRRVEVGSAGAHFEGADAAHGETGDVDAVRIGAVILDLLLNELRKDVDRGGAVFGEATHAAPGLAARALRSEDDDLAGRIGLDRADDGWEAQADLAGVVGVVAAFAAAVEEEQDGGLARGVHVIGAFAIPHLVARVGRVFKLFQVVVADDLEVAGALGILTLLPLWTLTALTEAALALRTLTALTEAALTLRTLSALTAGALTAATAEAARGFKFLLRDLHDFALFRADVGLDAALLREQPFPGFGVAVGLRPAVMLHAGIFLVEHVVVAGVFQCGVHATGEHHGHGRIGSTVEDPDREVFQLGFRLRGITAAAAGHRRREEVGAVTGDKVPRAVAAHGETGDVDAVGIGVKFLDFLLDEDRDKSERLRGLLGQLRAGAAAMERSPELAARAFRSEEDDFLLGVLDLLHNVGDGETDGGEVFVAAFADAVQEDDDGGLAGLVLIVDALAVPHAAVCVLDGFPRHIVLPQDPQFIGESLLDLGGHFFARGDHGRVGRRHECRIGRFVGGVGRACSQHADHGAAEHADTFFHDCSSMKID